MLNTGPLLEYHTAFNFMVKCMQKNRQCFEIMKELGGKDISLRERKGGQNIVITSLRHTKEEERRGREAKREEEERQSPGHV